MKIWMVVFATLLLGGCSTSVERVDSDTTIDLSGAWNDSDSRLVAEEMIQDALSRPWISDFTSRTGERPAVIVGTIRNLSHEHINLKTFVADIERELVNSGRVDFVAAKTERGEIRAERLDQDLNARDDTRNPAGQELGADFMLTGQINTIMPGFSAGKGIRPVTVAGRQPTPGNRATCNKPVFFQLLAGHQGVQHSQLLFAIVQLSLQLSHHSCQIRY